MPVSGGTIVIVLVLGLCAAATIYVTARSYMWSRKDHSGRPEDKASDAAPKTKDETDGKAPPSSG
jgi:hypothetical protein